MIRLYNLPENKNIKLYIGNEPHQVVVIFGHLDGLYSYCWLEEDKSKIVHINAVSQFEEYKDGYKLIPRDGENE